MEEEGGPGLDERRESADASAIFDVENCDFDGASGDGYNEGSYEEGEEEARVYDSAEEQADDDMTDFLMDHRDDLTLDMEGLNMEHLLDIGGPDEASAASSAALAPSASAPLLGQQAESERAPSATTPSGAGLNSLQKAGSAVLFISKVKKKKNDPAENMEKLRGDVRNKVQCTVKDRSGPSFEQRIAEASKRMRKEAVGTEHAMKSGIQQAMERGRSRPNSSAFRTLEETPESIEDRARRGRKEDKARTEQYWKENEERLQRMRDREPIFKLEEVAAGFAMLKERQEARKKELREDEQRRWGDIAKLQEKVMNRPFCMDNVRTFITPAELRKMASPIKEFGIDIKVKKAVAKKNFKESAWYQQVEEIKQRANDRAPLSEIKYNRGGVTPGNHVEVREVFYTADAAKRRMNLFKMGVVKNVDAQGNVEIDWDGNGKTNILAKADIKKIRYIPIVEKVRPRELGPLEKLVDTAVKQPWFKNSDWAKQTDEMREKMNNREKLHEISYPPKVREPPPVETPSPFILKIQADLAAHAEKKSEAMRADERKQRANLRAAIKEGLERRDRGAIGMK